MGNIILNMTAVSVIEGMNTSLETLVSQAYGAKRYDLCLVYLQRARVIMCMIFVPVSIIMLASGKILIALKQDPDVVKEA
jgi:MATE family multidrug resistance protein